MANLRCSAAEESEDTLNSFTSPTGYEPNVLTFGELNDSSVPFSFMILSTDQAGVITADDRAGNDLADAACKLLVLEHRAPLNVFSARPRVGSARQRLDIDSTWIPGRGRATARRREREQPWPLPFTRPSGDEGTRLSTALQGAFARSASTQSARHVASDQAPRAPERAAQVSVLCAVCGSYGGRVVRRSLLGKCPGTPLLGRRLAVPGSKRSARLDSIPGKVLRAQSGPCRIRGHVLRFCPAPLLSLQRCSTF